MSVFAAPSGGHHGLGYFTLDLPAKSASCFHIRGAETVRGGQDDAAVVDPPQPVRATTLPSDARYHPSLEAADPPAPEPSCTVDLP